IELPRSVSSGGKQMLTWFVLTLLLFGGLVALATAAAGRLMIISRIRRLHDFIHRVAEDHTTSQRLPITGNDEIADIARATNNLLDAVQSSQQALSASLRQTENELIRRRHTETALLDALEMAEAADRAKGCFMANISHEMRTPLNAMLGMSHLLLSSDLNEEQRDLAQTAVQSAEALLAIVNDILDLTQIENRQISLQSLPFSPVDLLSRLKREHDPLAAEKGLSITVTCPGHAPAVVVGDERRVAQIIDKLLDNAIKFSQSGTIILSYETRLSSSQRQYAAFCVADQGIGMDEATLARLEHPLTQGDESSTRRFGGLGLGLTLVRRLCDVMGCQLLIASRLGEGSQFTLLIPQDEGDDADDSFTGAIPGHVALLVDNSEVNTRLTVTLLKQHGINCQTVVNGSEMIATILSHPPGHYRPILVDCTSTETGGLAAVATLRNRERTMDCRHFIVGLAAMVDDDTASRARAAGVDLLVAKPLTHQAVQEILTCKNPGQD
ncbi:MAG: ATP-binding protein, partial [Negativicutes bacterium]|nr:ATP-binding protein [Negativicutes bacterium]